MANEQNLKHFTSENQPETDKKNRTGIPNRSTIARMVFEMKGEIPDTVFAKLKKRYPNLDKRGTIELIGTLQIADKMITDRDVPAYKALMDSAYGRPAQSIQLTGKDEGPIQIEDLSRLTADELRAEIAELENRRKEAAAGNG